MNSIKNKLENLREIIKQTVGVLAVAETKKQALRMLSYIEGANNLSIYLSIYLPIYLSIYLSDAIFIASSANYENINNKTIQDRKSLS